MNTSYLKDKIYEFIEHNKYENPLMHLINIALHYVWNPINSPGTPLPSKEDIYNGEYSNYILPCYYIILKGLNLQEFLEFLEMEWILCSNCSIERTVKFIDEVKRDEKFIEYMKNFKKDN